LQFFQPYLLLVNYLTALTLLTSPLELITVVKVNCFYTFNSDIKDSFVNFYKLISTKGYLTFSLA